MMVLPASFSVRRLFASCQMLTRDWWVPYIVGARVNDYHSLRWRSAHLFAGDHALPFHKN